MTEKEFPLLLVHSYCTSAHEDHLCSGEVYLKSLKIINQQKLSRKYLKKCCHICQCYVIFEKQKS